MDSVNLRYWLSATTLPAGAYEMILSGMYLTPYVYFEVPFRIFISSASPCITEAISMNTIWTDIYFIIGNPLKAFIPTPFTSLTCNTFVYSLF
jgi:hypothetical protein